ncbi:Uncharacterised protein [Mycobacteroides abscessus subsp. massiliense]|nr:Uncharacterised protein [Mycobacteroides abscessus subsp. massiliense]SKD47488.1 Uncharacterised protein [Mycobacteroides abscessus subsp. massiliense]SKD50102.1 Uncharacterised protein [Mycobacteroides abscessus subsp. massiliense]SKD59325.1 Uncharacterised protein [Mycobacteroides abscessus subsp. massiliense]SKD66725.1 Uncharacterised protein [Mycobacteroides abscessus subsp. massiliense]
MGSQLGWEMAEIGQVRDAELGHFLINITDREG